MKNILAATALGAAAIPAADPAFAQSAAWNYEATIYLFAPETKTAVTTPARLVEGTLSFGDAIENLDFAFMGAFAAEKGQWSILADVMYHDLSYGNDTPGPVHSGLNTTVTTRILNGYVGYRLYDSGTAEIDLAGGFRWFGTDTVMTLLPGTAPQRSTAIVASWIDPVIGVRTRKVFSDRWQGTAFFDYGGFSRGNETWQILLTADYTLRNSWLLRGGYRYISMENVVNGNSFKFTQSGAIFGVAYRF
ncbi:porin family protein [Leisingera sp.]|uniref:porin family protein n=1 Tax=Leisingera sp. TaxID=1879318 RepID=UPI002B279730|nr:porin family protein [Leisingera sp.]